MNSQKGLEFYKKFQSIVTRLNARIRGVNKVQDEERTQFLQSRTKIPADINVDHMPILSNQPGMKLKDYLPFMKGITNENRSIGPSLNNSILIPNSPAGTQIGTMLSNHPSSFTPSAPSLTPTPPSIPLVSSNHNHVSISASNLFSNRQPQQTLNNPASNSTLPTFSRNNEPAVPISNHQMIYPLPSSSTIMATGTNTVTSQISSPYLNYFSANNSGNNSLSSILPVYGPKCDPSKQSQPQQSVNNFEQIVKNIGTSQHQQQIFPNNNLGNFIDKCLIFLIGYISSR